MASRCLVIPFPMHRVQRVRPRPHRVRAANAALDAMRELDALELAQVKLCAWCFATSAVLTTTLGLAL